MNFEGKTYLVTGGVRRLGMQISLALAQHGANVVLHHAHSPDQAEEVKRTIEELGQKAWTIQMDLCNQENAESLVPRAWEFTPLAGVVNNAAIFGQEKWFDTSIENWNQTLGLNLTAPFLICRSYAKQLSEMDSGNIVNILDWRASRPGEDHLAYTISKAALAALTRSLAQSFAPRISVNALALGAILPPEQEPPAAGLEKKIPLKRWASVQEFTDAVLFLLSSPPDITGTIIHLDGGRHLI